MSVCIPVQKDIGEAKEKIAFGLSAKALGFLGIGVAVAAVEIGVMYFAFGMDASSVSTPVFATVGLAFAAGFIKPLGLPFEKAAPLMLRQYFGKTELTYASTVAKEQASALEEARAGKVEKDVRKQQKEYAKLRAGRYDRSPELVLPRVAAARRDIVDRIADGR